MGNFVKKFKTIFFKSEKLFNNKKGPLVHTSGIVDWNVVKTFN